MCTSRSDSEQRLHLKQQQQQAMGAMGSKGDVPATPTQAQQQQRGKLSQTEPQSEQQALFEKTAPVMFFNAFALVCVIMSISGVSGISNMSGGAVTSCGAAFGSREVLVT